MDGIIYDTIWSEDCHRHQRAFPLASRQASYRLFMLLDRGDFEINILVLLVVECEDEAKWIAWEIGFAYGDINDILDYICSVVRKRVIHFLWRPFLKDPQDDHVLELAVEAGCDFIVTHNVRDFSGSQQFGVRVVTPREFLRVIGGIS
jgi:predicted nucleic acid-binding protein